MTFRPTKCVVEIDGVRLWDANNGSINAWFPRRCPEKLSRVNSWAYARALIVPLVPGMEVVVRAHLAAKPKCKTCDGSGLVSIFGHDHNPCPDCKPAKKPAKKGAKRGK